MQLLRVPIKKRSSRLVTCDPQVRLLLFTAFFISANQSVCHIANWPKRRSNRERCKWLRAMFHQNHFDSAKFGRVWMFLVYARISTPYAGLLTNRNSSYILLTFFLHRFRFSFASFLLRHLLLLSSAPHSPLSLASRSLLFLHSGKQPFVPSVGHLSFFDFP